MQADSGPPAAPTAGQTSSGLARHILDPRDGIPARPGKFLIEDKSIQRLGKYPDIEAIHPGDVLLFAPIRPNSACRIIKDAHIARGFAATDAIWTHAAVYLRGGLLIEAVPPRVCITKLWHYVPDRLLRVRRPIGRRDPSTFGYRLALEMSTRLGELYENDMFWRVPLYRYFRWVRNGAVSASGRVFCSQVVADSFAALREGTIYQDGVDLDPFLQVTPAHLSHSTILEDVAVDWLATP